jgi:hypothetical protein
MNKNTFWKQVDQRVQENRVILDGGMPGILAPVMEKVGLHFLVIGMVVSLLLSLLLWLMYYQWVVNAVRVMIWR